KNRKVRSIAPPLREGRHLTSNMVKVDSGSSTSATIHRIDLLERGMNFTAIIVAAGSGSRFGGDLPKQWRLLGGKPVVRWSVEAMLAAGADEVIVVTGADEMHRLEQALADLPRWRAVAGAD